MYSFTLASFPFSCFLFHSFLFSLLSPGFFCQANVGRRVSEALSSSSLSLWSAKNGKKERKHPKESLSRKEREREKFKEKLGVSPKKKRGKGGKR